MSCVHWSFCGVIIEDGGWLSDDKNKPKVPNFDGSVFATGDKPLAFAMKGDGSHIACMTFKGNWLLPSLVQQYY
jgi:hypothetical protein